VPKVNSPSELEELRKKISASKDPNKLLIAICSGTACISAGSKDACTALEEEIKRQDLEKEIDIMKTGCHGFCEKGPLVVVTPKGVCYTSVKPVDAAEIVRSAKEGKIVDRLLYTDREGKKIEREIEIPFYKHQLRIVFGQNGLLDPRRIEDYIALGGYSALAKALFEMTPEQVLNEIKKSNLRGRGGGGFPAGSKWETTCNAPGEPKYVIINCDEGDPGTYKDRSLVEGNPHRVLEGLIIGAYAIGSRQGFIYVREEYPLAVENFGIALKQAEEYGFLGENIFGTDFSFHVKVHRGAGAFVSGESSALMNAIDGRLGEPRIKYVHTSTSGINGKPSNLNNAETWATVPLIIEKGADWFTSIGTEGSKGTKIFSLVGKVNNSGLIEVPMGITLGDIVYKIGGGIPKEKKFKGVQTGGPSGGVIPEQHLDTPVDFDELTKLGSMMGSGGMVVMDEDTCMVDMARFFANFLLEESCGKCIPCREGLRVLHKILSDICDGKGEDEDMQTIEDIAETMNEASLCALGTTATNPVLTTLRYFRNEYELHIKQKRCPAKVCKALIDYYIIPEKCQACLICLRNCPEGAVHGGKDMVHWIEQEKCTKCGSCYEVCNFDAVKKLSGELIPPPPPEGMKPLRKGRS
jgi:NADH-quinone oxidoreductase subunit F